MYFLEGMLRLGDDSVSKHLLHKQENLSLDPWRTNKRQT